MNEADRETAERHRAIWRQFRRRPAVNVRPGRPPLPDQVSAIAGFIIPVDDAAVSAALQRAIAPLQAGGWLQPFPPDYWHITVVPPALLSERRPDPPRVLPASFVDQALASAREAVRGCGPFAVTVRGLNAFRDVLVAVPYDAGRGLELGRAIRAALPQLPERYHTGHELLPHISLGQYARDDRLQELVSLLEQDRDTEFGSFRVERLEMYVLPEPEARPESVRAYPLPLEGR